MNASISQGTPRRWFAPEVVQTSAMDCGPAALKCLLEGFGVPVSYGRLREACQTDVDGTSIDTIEVVANQLGLAAEQRMLPPDALFARGADTLPALVVVRHVGGGTHFVVVWRRLGAWLQVMDPSTGRRWVRRDRFMEEVYRHETTVPAADWRDWAGSDEFLGPLRDRMARLGVAKREAAALVAKALVDPGWFGLGALDAAARLLQALVASGGVRTGSAAAKLLTALFDDTCASTSHIFAIIPPAYWMVIPDLASPDAARQRLTLRGAVLVRVAGRRAGAASAAGGEDDAAPALSPELAAALREVPATPLRVVWDLVRAEGLFRPLLLAGALGLSAGAVLIETLLFRGLFDIASLLNLASQRLAAIAAVVLFSALLLLMEVPLVTEAMRFGRHLEIRLRMALLTKLPRLPDRYFQSRPISDMADRGHGIHLARLLPGMATHAVQSLAELALTLLGIILIDPASAGWAIGVVAAAICVPTLAQPLVRERDLRLRNHAGALGGFYLDALLGLVPVRAHRAQKAVLRLHEGLLVEWARSGRRLLGLSVLADGVQSLLCLGLAGALLVQHFLRASGAAPGDLLLVYWTLKLPAIGHGLTLLAHQFPVQQNALARLLEPLSAPEDTAAEAEDRLPSPVIPRLDRETSASTMSQEIPRSSRGMTGEGSRRDADPIGKCANAATSPGADAIHGAATTHSTDAKQAEAPAPGMAIAIRDGLVLASGHTILRDINLTIAPGEHIAVVGKSGAGKSTLIGLLLGWHRLAEGTVRVDGAPLTAKAQERVRRGTAWVDPGVQIWNRGFVENLGYSSEDGGLARIGPVIEAAHLRGILRNLPDGMQTPLGEGGALLSGGEGQRVRLGRAFTQTNVRLALLDEPFRGMDRARRSSLLADARKRWAGVTLLCVTHDMGETAPFDRVLVIEDGRIVEDGPPARLAAEPSRYQALLAAERDVLGRMWEGKDWRRVTLREGHVEEVA